MASKPPGNSTTERPMNHPKQQTRNIARSEEARKRLTRLRDEEEEHDESGDDSDDAPGERAAVEVLVDLRVRVEVLKLVEDLHLQTLIQSNRGNKP